jgi:hypothetical protein
MEPREALELQELREDKVQLELQVRLVQVDHRVVQLEQEQTLSSFLTA